jgi:hypothetical protein
VISASSSALGSALTCVSTRNTWRPGSIRPFMQAYTGTSCGVLAAPPGRMPITWSM